MSIARSTPAQNDRGAGQQHRSRPGQVGPHAAAPGRSGAAPAVPSPPRRTVRNRATGVYAVSTMTRTTAIGRSRVGSARTIAADSMSTASAPVRGQPLALLPADDVIACSPSARCARAGPCCRNSATSGAAARRTVRPMSSRTSLATTTSPARSVRVEAAGDPGHHDRLRRERGEPRQPRLHPLHAHAAPLDQRTGHLPGNAAYSVRSAVTTSSSVTPSSPRAGERSGRER